MQLEKNKLTTEQKLFVLDNINNKYIQFDVDNEILQKIINTSDLCEFLSDFEMELNQKLGRTYFANIYYHKKGKGITRAFEILYGLRIKRRKYLEKMKEEYVSIGSSEGFKFKDIYYIKLSTFAKMIFNCFIVKNYKAEMQKLESLFIKWELPFRLKWYKNAVGLIEIDLPAGE